MGLFDSLKKLGEDLGKEIEKSVGSDTFKNIKDAVANTNLSNFNSESKNSKEIPSEYNEFPKFKETAEYLTTAQTSNYIRCTMDYPSATEQEISDYVLRITSLGYVKNSNVRYDKDNTYIIVDTENRGLHLVFHIKR